MEDLRLFMPVQSKTKTEGTLVRKAPLRKMSSDKARETRKYWPLRRKYIEDHPTCEFPAINDPLVYTPTCMNRTISIHHMNGQNWRVMNETKWWLATCIEHHTWIEAHKNSARKLGIILYK